MSRPKRRCSTFLLLSALLFLFGEEIPISAPVHAGGTLFIIGGGLKANNSAVIETMLTAGGGARNCRVAIFRTASSSLEGAKHFSSLLQRYQVPADHIEIMDIHPANAHQTAYDPVNTQRLSRCSIFYFIGGSQRRITQSLLRDDGTDTPVLATIRKVLDQGGVVAGTSAGAAMQSEVMMAVSGLPDDALDEGMDALDFGTSDNPQRRGLYVARGLSFFPKGIIDQHFGQFRGRVGRLSRTLIEKKIRFGFGVDENTALIVTPGGDLEARGTGYVTIIDAQDATMTDGPLGCHMKGLRLSCISDRDRFHPDTSTLTVSPQKKPVDKAEGFNHGNYLMTDIAGNGALKHALFQGLAENTSLKQTGIWLRFSQTFSHGYRFTFQKTDRSQSWAGPEDDSYSYAVRDFSLTVEPILSTLLPPESALPPDLPQGTTGEVCKGLWFRGILTTDAQHHLRPDSAMTRAELAIAITQAVHLLPPIGDGPTINDLNEASPVYESVSRVLNHKLFELDPSGNVRPDGSVSRQDAARIFMELHAYNGGPNTKSASVTLIDDSSIKPANRGFVLTALQAGLLQSDDGRFRPDDDLTRKEAAAAIFKILQFPWLR